MGVRKSAMSQESDIEWGAFCSSLLKSWGIPGYCDETEKGVESHLSSHPIQSAFGGKAYTVRWNGLIAE